MTRFAQTPIIEALQDPAATRDWSIRRWDGFLRLARNFNLLAKFAYRAEAAGCSDSFPVQVREQLIAARNIAAHHRRMVTWEAHCLRNILSFHQIDFLLLKGAAYVLANLPAGEGRTVSDIDILVRKEDLSRTEELLLRAGWAHTKLEPYDQRYFRHYMHELPPLKHRDRKTLLDVHHNILPESGRLHPDPRELWNLAENPDGKGWRVLCPEDMVLHSAAHMFLDGEMGGGLRDLFDLDDLMRHFASQDLRFWDRLVPRATQLDLGRPLFYALSSCKDILYTPVPEQTLQLAAAEAPNRVVRELMRHLTARTLVPMDRDGHMPKYPWQQTAMYIRSHWLKMPPLLLARHLAHQALRTHFPKLSA